MYDCLYQLRDFGVFKGYTERVRKQKKRKKNTGIYGISIFKGMRDVYQDS